MPQAVAWPAPGPHDPLKASLSSLLIKGEAAWSAIVYSVPASARAKKVFDCPAMSRFRQDFAKNLFAYLVPPVCLYANQ